MSKVPGPQSLASQLLKRSLVINVGINTETVNKYQDELLRLGNRGFFSIFLPVDQNDSAKANL